MSRRLYYLYFSFLLLFVSVFSASAQSSYSIKGKVFNQKDSSILSNAHIFLDGSSIGTTSNSQGVFKFVFDKNKYKEHQLVVSYLGKVSFHAPVNTLLNEYLNIYLEDAQFLLDEIQVSNLNGLDIMKKTVANINVNYSSRKLNYDLHYKEFRSRNDSSLSYLEIAANLISKGFDNKVVGAKNYNRVSIKGKKRSENLDEEYNGGNGLFTVFWCNWARGFLTKKALRKYTYKNRGLTNYQDHQVYKIEALRPNQSGSTYIYIDKEAYAFVAIQYQIENKDVNVKNLKGSWGFIKLDLTLQFRNNGDYWHIALIDDFRKSLTINGTVSSSKRSIRVVDVTEQLKLDEQSNIKPNTNLFEYPFKYDNEFWNNYNAPIQSKEELEFIKRLEMN